MFHSARIKLTAWYLLIIMLISILFSIAFYRLATLEIERVLTRVEFRQINPNRPQPNTQFRLYAANPQVLRDLEESKRIIKNTLILINATIFIVSGAAGFILAGRTLKPIKLMIDEQNQFISSASHELRTPLAVLRAEMEASLLEKNLTDKTSRKLIKSNLEELSTLQNLTNNLLRIAQVHSINGEDIKSNVSLLSVVNLAVKKVTPLAKKKSITILKNANEVKLTGNKPNLVEALVILLDNAIKYSPTKTTITISLQKTKNAIVLKVTNQGIGIAKKEQPKIFERFYRSEIFKSKVQGYGLGLSIAKKIITTHNGEISVTSTPKKGTTFTIKFETPNQT